MNGIIGMTALTLDTQLNRAQRENLMIVSNLANNLLTIIDDIVSQELPRKVQLLIST